MRCFAALFVAALWATLERPASAALTAADAARLEWIRLEGAEGCPTRSVFEQAVRTRMAGNPFSTTGRRMLTIELSRESGPYRAVLILKSDRSQGVDSRQELFSYSSACDELFGATVLSVSLLLSPREDDEANVVESREEEPTEETPLAEPPSPPAPRPKIELSPPAPLTPSEPAEIPRAPRPWARKHSRALVSAIVSFEQLPRTALGLALRGEFPIAPQWLLALEGSRVGAQLTARGENGARLGFGASAGWLDAVWVMYRLDPLEVLLDGGIGLTVLHAHTDGGVGPGGDSVRAAARLGLGFNLQVDSHVALCSAFSAELVVNPARFTVPGGPTWNQTWLAGQLHLGLAIDFP